MANEKSAGNARSKKLKPKPKNIFDSLTKYRKCLRCHLTKPSWDFYSDKGRRCGLDKYCIPCKKVVNQLSKKLVCPECDERFRLLDSNELCSGCNRKFGLQECKECKELKFILVDFVYRKTVCYDCNPTRPHRALTEI
jgi:hypothetical protein